ncbi:MAG: ABC transporter permease [Acidimicrobiales bacterium]
MNTGAYRRILAIAGTDLRRLFRERSNLFFVLVLPLVLILVLGTVFGSFEPRIAVIHDGDDPIAADLVAAIEDIDGADVETGTDVDAALRSLRRDDLEAVVIVPDDLGARIRAGESVEIGFVSVPDSGGFETRTLVDAVIADTAARLSIARFLDGEGLVGFDEALGDDTVASATGPDLSVAVQDPDGRPPSDTDQRGFLAAQQLVLFVFVNSLAAATAIITTRRLGVARRMLATPTRTWEVVAGIGLGRFAIAAFQGVFIVVAAWAVFGVDWGDPVASLSLVVMFALVGTGAAILVGSTFSNEAQAGPFGIFAALGLAALGGSMVPLEVYSDGLRRIAHITPHAWANEGFSTIIREGGGIGDIATELAVLAGFALVLIGVASVSLHRALTR